VGALADAALGVARIGVDATSVAPEGKGISRVQRRTVEALSALGSHDLVVFARHPAELPGALPVTERPALAWEQRGLPRAVRRHRLDAMLTWTERLPLAGAGRYLVWLFEPPTHRIRQNRISGAGAYQRASDLVTLALWRRSLRRAALVLAGSLATARAVGVPARVLYPGSDPEFAPGPGRDGRYVLHIGSSDPRDDTETALAAFAAAGLPGDVRLLVAGGYRGPARERVEYLGRVTDAELLALYRGALAYLDTSLYEGFGFQVLEAMACGAPVVATSVTSIPEIAGDAALLRAAGRPDELGEALRRVVEDETLAAELRRRGPERAAAFSWETTASTLAEAVDEVLA
jgi:glycosyltransferase involved in cell wall biosynthesis